MRQKCYLIGDFNVNLISGNKILLRTQCPDSYSQVTPLVKKFMNIYFYHSLHQLAVEPKKTTEGTKTVIGIIHLVRRQNFPKN